jgi:hypothetical protein
MPRENVEIGRFRAQKKRFMLWTHFRDCHSVLPDVSIWTISFIGYFYVAVQTTETLADNPAWAL